MASGCSPAKKQQQQQQEKKIQLNEDFFTLVYLREWQASKHHQKRYSMKKQNKSAITSNENA